MAKKEPAVDYKMVEELGRILCGPSFEHADPLEQAAALNAAQPTAAALVTYLVERRGAVIQKAIADKVTTNVGAAKHLGVARSRITAMISDGEKAKAKRLAASETGADEPTDAVE
jgi:hypothetical protein